METDSFIRLLTPLEGLLGDGVRYVLFSRTRGNFVEGADWIERQRNPPVASHKGGVWERQLRSVRNILSSLMSIHRQGLSPLWVERNRR